MINIQIIGPRNVSRSEYITLQYTSFHRLLKRSMLATFYCVCVRDFLFNSDITKRLNLKQDAGDVIFTDHIKGTCPGLKS